MDVDQPSPSAQDTQSIVISDGTPQGEAPDTIQVLANAGVEAVGGKPTEYGKAILDENERLVKAIKAAGIKQE